MPFFFNSIGRSLLPLLVLLFACTFCAKGQSFTFVELNCENLFDCSHDSLKQDYEFCEGGTRNWTPGRYWRKVNNIAREIFSCGEGEEWNIPDLVALVEVENDSVMTTLAKRSLLKKMRYEYVMTDSPDERGIDVALLYSPHSFSLEKHCSLRVPMPKGHRPTRDILYVSGKFRIGRGAKPLPLHVFVVHAPSRFGGEKSTEPLRMLVCNRLCQAIDSIRLVTPDANIIVAGDFNDYHDSKSVLQLSKHGMHNISAGSKGTHGAEGTYFFQGEWGSLDQILVSETLLSRYPKMRCHVNDAEFLIEPDSKTGGVRPIRTYRGPAYNPNGFSDHLPLVLRINP